MVGAKPKRRIRDRTGYVMIQLSPAERAKLEGIRDRMEAEQGYKVSLSDVVRNWLHRAD